MGACNSAYINQPKFLREKAGKLIGGKPEVRNMQAQLLMDWGVFFEPIHRKIIEVALTADIIETSLIQGKGCFKGCHQSPDGIAIVDTQ